MPIGDKLKALRLQKELTLEEVSKSTGVTRQTYFRYETGEIQNIPLHNIEKLAAFFCVSPAYLCGWPERKTTMELTAEEMRLIRDYRRLSDVSKEVVQDTVAARLARDNTAAEKKEA